MRQVKIYTGGNPRTAAFNETNNMHRVVIEGEFFEKQRPRWQLMQNINAETQAIIIDRPRVLSQSLLSLIQSEFLTVNHTSISPNIYIVPTADFLAQLNEKIETGFLAETHT